MTFYTFIAIMHNKKRLKKCNAFDNYLLIESISSQREEKYAKVGIYNN